LTISTSSASRSRLRLATSPELDGVSGRFFDRQEEAAAHGQAYDAVEGRRLWDLSLELVGEPDPFA